MKQSQLSLCTYRIYLDMYVYDIGTQVFVFILFVKDKYNIGIYKNIKIYITFTEHSSQS